jgi:rubredoxin
MVIFNHWQKAQCSVCETVYDPDLGDEAQGVPPKTPFDKLPDDWRCECGASKRMLSPQSAT